MTSSGGITVDGIGVTYPGAPAPVLHDVSFAVPHGSSLLIVGGSGSGKSTLLSVLAGIIPHTIDADVVGSVHIGASDAWGGGPRTLAAHLGLVQQDPLSQICLDGVRSEVELALESRAWAPEHILSSTDAALAKVGGGALANRRTSELSGGQSQRVATAAAIAPCPDVLLLDEPSALLDPQAARDVGQLVGTLGASATTTVVIEHRLDDLHPLPDLTAVIKDGRLAAFGPTTAVLREHARDLVADGCWVPTDHLLRIAGAPAPPDDVVIDPWLRDVARSAPKSPDTSINPGSLGSPVLRVRDFAASHRRGLTHRRRTSSELDVVSGLDLDLHRGEVVAVLGVNGSGKSTLVHGLAGSVPTSGSIDRGSVSVVAQHPEHQFVARTVADEVAFTPRAAGVPPAEVHARVNRALACFGLTHRRDRSPYRLSGGEQRRLSLASALVHPTDIVLADEPTFGLDRTGFITTANALRTTADKGAGVVVVTHDLSFAGRIADRILILAGGRKAALGDCDEILADAATLNRAGLPVPPIIHAWARLTERPRLRSMLLGIDHRVSETTR